jgi:hypothetical protein
MMNIKNIIKVETIKISNLSILFKLSDNTVLLKDIDNFFDLSAKKPASVEISDAIEGKNRIYTTKLVFQTCTDFNPKNNFLAFLLTSASGFRYLIGTTERPYPVITSVDPYPSAMTDSSLKTVTVTYKNTIPMLTVVV